MGVDRDSRIERNKCNQPDSSQHSHSHLQPHPRHYILVQHYDHRRAEWYPWSWFIPSTDFAKLARGKGAYLLFTTTLNSGHVNRWSPYRVPTADAAAMFRQALQATARRKTAV